MKLIDVSADEHWLSHDELSQHTVRHHAVPASLLGDRWLRALGALSCESTLENPHGWCACILVRTRMQTIVNQVQQQKFSSRINIVGILATSIIPACGVCCSVCFHSHACFVSHGHHVGLAGAHSHRHEHGAARFGFTGFWLHACAWCTDDCKQVDV